MRTRLWPSALRTPGRLYRHTRRHVAREAAKGNDMTGLPATTMKSCTEVIQILRDLHASKHYGLARR